jgi:prolyl-tRNA synthetase
MLWSKLFIPTLREDPAEAETPGHRLLLRAGYIRPLAAGLYIHLFLSQRSLLKITVIVREEMDRIGAQEMLLPALREETMTVIARGELRSHRQFPQIWYQIQTRFLDEPRPGQGRSRVRQFIMQDSYSFDLAPEGLDAAYDQHRQAYTRIFQRCGLEVISVGTDGSIEFMAVSESGAESVAVCPKCGYAADLERATAREQAPLQPDPEGALSPEVFPTPSRKTIAEVAGFTGLPATSQIKSLVMVADGRPVLALLRGDHQLSETKLAETLGSAALGGPGELRAAYPAEIQDWFGAAAGSLGPVGVKNMRVLADDALLGRRNMIAGANLDDYHLRNVTPGEDFSAGFRDLRRVEVGDACSGCGTAIEVRKAIGIGHIRKLGYRYAESMGLRIRDDSGKEAAPFMGSYGIAMERILSSVVEQNHDSDGMILPAAIAPFTVVITPVSVSGEELRQAAESIYRACLAEGLDAVLDDRDLRPGVKFKDADLTGIPWRIVVGKKLANGVVEVVERRSRKSMDVAVGDVVRVVARKVEV